MNSASKAQDSPTSNAVATTDTTDITPVNATNGSHIALGSHSELSCEESALAIRDQVNGFTAGRLVLRNISMAPPSKQHGQRAILFFLDTEAPACYWDDLEGACLTIEWEAGVHSVEQTVQHILNDTPEAT